MYRRRYKRRNQWERERGGGRANRPSAARSTVTRRKRALCTRAFIGPKFYRGRTRNYGILLREQLTSPVLLLLVSPLVSRFFCSRCPRVFITNVARLNSPKVARKPWISPLGTIGSETTGAPLIGFSAIQVASAGACLHFSARPLFYLHQPLPPLDL